MLILPHEINTRVSFISVSLVCRGCRSTGAWWRYTFPEKEKEGTSESTFSYAKHALRSTLWGVPL